MKRMIACAFAGLGLLLAMPATADPGDRYRHGKSGHHAEQYRGKGHDRGYRNSRDHDGRYDKRHYRKGYHRYAHGRHGVKRWPRHRHVHDCRHPVHYYRTYYPRSYYDPGVTIRVDDFYFGWRGY